MYSRDVVFREIKDVAKYEVLPREKKIEKMEFELKDDESNYTEELEYKEKEPCIPILRRLL